MSEKRPPHPPRQVPEGHEEMDVGGYGFLIFTILFVSGLALSSLLLIWLLGRLAAGTPAEPASALGGRVVPEGPRLQASIIHPETPREDLARLREHHRKLLESYGWVEQKNQIARVPVDRAIDLFIARGAPANPFGPASRPAAATATAPSGGAP